MIDCWKCWGRRMGPMPEWKADRVKKGASINLNWDKYYIEIVPAGAVNG